MSVIGWNILLLVGKWFFIIFVYLSLFLVVIAVRREMSMRMGGPRSVSTLAAGRLKVIHPGSDERLRPGNLLDLQVDNLLGARPENDIVLLDQFISGQHARLRWDGASWWVEDLGSKNGTFIGQKPCPAHKPQVIPPGATLQLGGMTFDLLE